MTFCAKLSELESIHVQIIVKISDYRHVLGELKILLDDERCPTNNNIHQIRAHCTLYSYRFVHFLQGLLCVQHRKIAGTNTSMGSRRNLSSDQMRQTVGLANDSYCQRHITEESSAAAGLTDC